MISAHTPLSRWQAAGIHVLGSLGLAVIAGLLIFGLWYPQPYTAAAGADKLIMLLIGIDLALGPLCTLVVWRVGKKGLWFDLSVIGTLQIAALVYGLIVIAESRPVFIVVTKDVTYLTTASMLGDAELSEASHPEFGRRSWLGPVQVAAPMPEDPEERSRLMDLGLAGKDINVLPKHFRRWEEAGPALVAGSPPLERLRELPEAKAAVDTFLEAHGLNVDALRFQALRGRDPARDTTLVYEAASGAVVGAISVDPWPALSSRESAD